MQAVVNKKSQIAVDDIDLNSEHSETLESVAVTSGVEWKEKEATAM